MLLKNEFAISFSFSEVKKCCNKSKKNNYEKTIINS